MTEPENPVSFSKPTTPGSDAFGTPPPPLQPQGHGQVAPQGQPVAYSNPAAIGKVRGTGVAILLTLVTLGIYPIYWFYSVHEEMKRHRGTGLGGGIALVLAIFVGVVMPYITSSEVGEMQASRGQAKHVSGATGLWYFPGIFILVGPIVWFVKTNGAINAYWRSLGAA